MAQVEARQLVKRYADNAALKGFSHVFPGGKITAVLGPSGSGKSTLLSLLAGLQPPDEGGISLDGRDIARLPAERRDFGLVFQNYALFPHLTVAENVGFGLRVRGLPAAERRERVRETLELVRIPHLAERHIHQISGGEQQRVAIARALAFRPKVLLMDEPLSALDARLREDLRAELSRLLRGLDATTIYVTHDQVEALGLGDELVILRDGVIEQSGPPQIVYRHPATSFVASFLGAANVIPATFREGKIELPFVRLVHEDASGIQGPCLAVIRPEDLELATADGPGAFAAELESSLFLGNRMRLHLVAGGERLTADLQDGNQVQAGAPVHLRIRPGRLTLLPA